MNETLPAQKKSVIAIGIYLTLFVLALPYLFSLVGLKSVSYSPKYLYGNELYYWTALGLIFLYVSKIEKQKFLMWKEKSYPFWYYVKSVLKLFLVLFLVSLVISIILKLAGVNNTSIKKDDILRALHQNKILIVLIPLRAGITEELIFRGYLLPRLTVFTKKIWVSICISSAIFGILHISYGTLGQVIVPLCMGILFALHYYKYRNLKIVIAGHFLWDFVSLYFNVR